jgi:predicted secreted protein
LRHFTLCDEFLHAGLDESDLDEDLVGGAVRMKHFALPFQESM